MGKMVRLLQGGDTITFYWLNRTLRARYLDRIMPMITHLGGAIVSVSLSLVFLLANDSLLRNLGKHLAMSLLISHLIVVFCKKSFPRRRPHQALDEVFTAGNVLHDPSFPSGHATAAFCVAATLAPLFSVGAICLYALASIVAYSRVYLGLHYPSDVLIGSCLGITTTLFIGNF
jgi:undecaprenyl-diphosphatase